MIHTKAIAYVSNSLLKYVQNIEIMREKLVSQIMATLHSLLKMENQFMDKIEKHMQKKDEQILPDYEVKDFPVLCKMI